MPLCPLGKQTLNLAIEGQIFDEGKPLQPNTLKKGFPSPGTGRYIAAQPLRPCGRYSTNGEGIGRGEAGRLSALPNRLG